MNKKNKLYFFIIGFIVNVVIIILDFMTLIKGVQYLKMKSRTAHDNEQMIMCIVMFFGLIILFVICNFWLPKLINGLLDKVDDKQANNNMHTIGRKYTLQFMLRKLKGGQGLIVWDTIWGSMSGFMILVFIVFFKTCNKTFCIGSIIFLLIMLVGGHILGKDIGSLRNYESRMCRFTKQYIEIFHEDSFIANVDASIKNGVIYFTKYWVLTEDYMLGRLSDITFEPIAIPRTDIVNCEFNYLNRETYKRGLPIGILSIQLKNGKNVKLTLGRGSACNEPVNALKEQGLL